MTTKIKVTDFDFDTIKLDFKTYLSSRPEFTDYNFEGSNLNVLLDILAYNTHYHSLTANFLANEMFLDTAAKRSSVVSHSKTLGYVPKSKSSAKATVTVDISFTNASDPGSSFVLEKGRSLFKTNVDGNNFNFTTASNFTAPIIHDTGNNYTVSYPNITIYEGEYTITTGTYSTLTKFVNIPNLDVDLSTLVVEVRDPFKEAYINYTYAKNLIDIGADNTVFFIQEGFDGKYQIYFGDGTFGAEPAEGSLVRMSYIITHGLIGNGATNWVLNNPSSTIMSANYAYAPITGVSIGGSDRETIASIKFNSINHFGTQNRAVVANDYATLAKQYSDNIKNILAWGGEEDTPPMYNSVIMCAIPNQGEDLTDNEKSAIKNYLKSKAVGSTNIVFKVPEYLDMQMDVEFTYDTKIIKISAYELESNVRDTIGIYAKDYLYNFSSTFKQSRFLTTLDRVSDAITGTTTKIKLVKTLPVHTFYSQAHVVDFSNQLNTNSLEPTIWSSKFYTNLTTNICFLMDYYRNGTVQLVSQDGANIQVIAANVGSINYTTGKVAVQMYVTSYPDAKFQLYANPISNNIVSNRNNILRIKNENVTVTSKGE